MSARFRNRTRRPSSARRCPGIEPLEGRALLAAVAPTSHPISPAWFARVGAPAQPAVAQSPVLAAISWGGRSMETRKDEWVVQLTDAGLARAPTVAAAAGLFVGSPFPLQVVGGLGMTGSLLVETPGASAEAVRAWLGRQQVVASFEPNVEVSARSIPNDPDFGSLWGLNNTGQAGGTPDADIDAPEAWDLTTGSRANVVGVIDTGVDYTHPDLAANIWTNPGEVAGNGVDDDGDGFVDDVHGYDFANDDGDPMDDNGHGTHVAGTIAAAGNNGSGVVGVDWSASIMALKFLDATGYGSLANAVRAINYATMMHDRYGVNLRVTNNSWGGSGSSPDLYSAIQASGASGLLFVAAVDDGGNDQTGDNSDSVADYPASYDLDNIVAVAATDNADRLASFSNFGAKSVDLAAPGVNIRSTLPGWQYGYDSGTSMAAPHVTGVAALAWSFAPNATATMVRDAILGGVDPVPSLAGKVATGGRLNARRTLDLLGGDWTQTTTPGVTVVAVQDVNGDGKGDLVLQYDYNDARRWQARLSTGSSFAYNGDWTVTTTPGVTPVAVEDVNGDHRADLVLQYDYNGSRRWQARLSTGSSFAYSGDWAQTATPGVTVAGVKDVNGDGKADLVLQYDWNGTRYWQARVSTGSSFIYVGQWAQTTTPGVSAVAVQDVDGDRKADLVLQYDYNGSRRWKARWSTGNAFA